MYYHIITATTYRAFHAMLKMHLFGLSARLKPNPDALLFCSVFVQFIMSFCWKSQANCYVHPIKSLSVLTYETKNMYCFWKTVVFQLLSWTWWISRSKGLIFMAFVVLIVGLWRLDQLNLCNKHFFLSRIPTGFFKSISYPVLSNLSLSLHYCLGNKAGLALWERLLE